MKNFSEVLLPLIVKAGEKMLGAHDIEDGGNVMEKMGDAANMVTIYDVAVQNFLIEEITKAIPEAYFIAEEKENDARVLERDYCFIIDPIDGTSNFVHNYRHSCISVALFSRGEAVFSAVYDPYQNEMFSAEKGKGAYLNGNPMQVLERDMAHSIVAMGTCPYYKDTLGAATFRCAEALYHACSDIRRAGAAALDLAYLAAGRNDVFFEYLLSPWDIAAGALLIKEAGGIITNMQGEEINFAAPSSVLAATPAVYENVLAIAKTIEV